jgi:hypothetical protein
MKNEEQTLLTKSSASQEVEFSNVGESNPTTAGDFADDGSDPGTPRQVGGAAAAGCLAGLVLAGPIVAALAALGAAAVATSRGKPGNFARASGDAIADAGDRLKRYDEKHHVVAKSTRWISKTLHHDRESSSQRSSMVV